LTAFAAQAATIVAGRIVGTVALEDDFGDAV
jgi:hypothetical protein